MPESDSSVKRLHRAVHGTVPDGVISAGARDVLVAEAAVRIEQLRALNRALERTLLLYFASHEPADRRRSAEARARHGGGDVGPEQAGTGQAVPG